MRKYFWIFILLIGLLGTAASIGANASSPQIVVLQVNGTIVPVTADYLDRGISEAESQNAAVIIELDTPGGLYDSTQKIVRRIMNSEVPVVVYVCPTGARAASAGVFITMSANIAAMAPGTHIGAAHPVSSSGGELSDTMQEKITNDAVAWIKSIAKERGRNVEWAEKAVRGSKSITDEEALEQNVIDLRAENLESLISQLNGIEVKVKGEEVVLNTQGYYKKEIGMNFVERFLHAISDPNIAYILLSLGSIGLIVEISHPGAIFPGVIGALSLVMSFYSLSVLNAYWAGVLLIFLAVGLFIAEIFITSHGALTAGGLASLVGGSLILFSGQNSLPGFSLEVNRWLIALVVVGAALFCGFVLQAIIRTQRRPQPTGKEGLIGRVAEVQTPLNPEGTVFIHGEIWRAILDEGEADSGEEVVITGVERLKLKVTRKNKEVES